MRNLRYGILALLVCVSGGIVSGCSALPEVPERPLQSIDRCAERLHGIAGALLLYYSVNASFPKSLDELQALSAEDMRCPESGRPYTYHRTGKSVASTTGILMIQDSSPVHNGGCWGVFLTINESISTDVVWFAEND